jgi:hypothetical protein
MKALNRTNSSRGTLPEEEDCVIIKRAAGGTPPKISRMQQGGGLTREDNTNGQKSEEKNIDTPTNSTRANSQGGVGVGGGAKHAHPSPVRAATGRRLHFQEHVFRMCLNRP